MKAGEGETAAQSLAGVSRAIDSTVLDQKEIQNTELLSRIYDRNVSSHPQSAGRPAAKYWHAVRWDNAVCSPGESEPGPKESREKITEAALNKPDSLNGDSQIRNKEVHIVSS